MIAGGCRRAYTKMAAMTTTARPAPTRHDVDVIDFLIILPVLMISIALAE